ncbi:MAG: thioredoxin [Planctomycetota bacterium]
MSKAATFTDANFPTEVLESNQLVLVDFWAAWCGPCRALGPTIDALAEQYEGEVKIGKLNVDDNPEVASQLGISSIPAVLLFKDGEVIETLVGVRAKEAYEQALQLAAA